MGLTDWTNDIKPTHTVTIPPFAIGRREITREEYAVFAWRDLSVGRRSPTRRVLR